MDMEVTLAGGKKVNAAYNKFVVKTDQPIDEGGEGKCTGTL